MSLPRDPCRTPRCAQTPVWGFSLLRGHGPLSPRTTTENRGSQRPRLPPATHGAPGDPAAGPRPPQGPRGWRTSPPVPADSGQLPGGLRSRLCSTGLPDRAARLLEAVLVNYSFLPGANSQSLFKAINNTRSQRRRVLTGHTWEGELARGLREETNGPPTPVIHTGQDGSGLLHQQRGTSGS